MSMSFGDDNEVRGGGGLATGLAMGSMLNNRRDDQGGYWIFAIVIFVIFIVLALVFLAFMKGERHDRKDYGGTDIAAILTPLIAAKGLDCNNGYNRCDIDKLYEKLEHNEDRARQTQTQQEIGSVKSELGAVALMMQKTACDNEKENLKEFGEIKQQLGMQTMALNQLMMKSNNQDIINGVIQQLMCGKPCIA